MLVVGVTITEAAAPGFTPLLAVQVKGPAPEEVKFVLAPKHIVVLDGVIEVVNVGEIETVATAVVVQPPIPDKTVYVVVDDGVTITLAELGGFVPELADQTKGPVPVVDNDTLSPKQIVVFVGVIFIAAVAPTETVATAWVVQAPVPDKTV